MNVTTQIGALQEYALNQIAAGINAARPLDAEGSPIGEAVAPEGYLQARIADLLTDYCREHCRISGTSAVLRLTTAEIGRIRGAMAANEQVKAAATPLLQGQRVELAGPLWQQGVRMLATAGLLDSPARVEALLAPPQEGEALA